MTDDRIPSRDQLVADLDNTRAFVETAHLNYMDKLDALADAATLLTEAIEAHRSARHRYYDNRVWAT